MEVYTRFEKGYTVITVKNQYGEKTRRLKGNLLNLSDLPKVQRLQQKLKEELINEQKRP